MTDRNALEWPDYEIVIGGDVSNLVPQLIPRKIPKSMLEGFLKRANEWSLEKGEEIQWDLYYDNLINDFVWDEPVQETTATRVFPEINFDMQTAIYTDETGVNRLRYQFLGSIHSHHTMKVFISSIDAKSQSVFQLFGILGCFPPGEILELDFITPETILFSTFYNGKHYIIPYEEVIAND